MLTAEKLVRVNDIRIAVVEQGAFLIAVDVGRRDYAQDRNCQTNTVFIKAFGLFANISFINWDDVEILISRVDWTSSFPKNYLSCIPCIPSDKQILSKIRQNHTDGILP